MFNDAAANKMQSEQPRDSGIYSLMADGKLLLNFRNRDLHVGG